MKHSLLLFVLIFLVACQPVTAVPELTPTSAPAPQIPVHYELRQPSSADLLQMIDSVLLMEEQMPHNDDLTTTILEREPDSLQRLIGEDFERYYLDGFAGAEKLVTRQTLPWKMRFFGDLSSFSAILQIALLQYINNHQDVLEENRPFQLPIYHYKNLFNGS